MNKTDYEMQKYEDRITIIVFKIVCCNLFWFALWSLTPLTTIKHHKPNQNKIRHTNLRVRNFILCAHFFKL
jgi:hypothetical protein